MNTTADDQIRRTFHELTLTMVGLFETYQLDPDFVEHAADEIETILRRSLPAPPCERRVRGKLALERLLDELEAASSAATE